MFMRGTWGTAMRLGIVWMTSLAAHEMALGAAVRLLRRRLLPAVIAGPLVLGAAAVAAPADAPAGPEELVDHFDATLLQVMREARKIGYQARYDKLAAVMNETFDFEGMTRVAVGPAWAGVAADQKHALIAAFREFSIATYAAEFDDYSGERFVTEPPAQVPQGLLVTATLIPKDDKPVKLGYLLHDVAGSWRVIDIYLDGTISQLAVRRSEFSAVLSQSGPEGLVDKLFEKAKKLEQGTRSAR